MGETISTQTLENMKQYYRERAAEYDDWFYRRGLFDRGEAINALWFAEADEVVAELERLHLAGDILELAPGTGIWTERLIRQATTITAVDASAEMIAINRARVGSDRVQYQQSDLFQWRPERAYDGVFFGFWLSHVPLERLDTFLHTVAQALRPGGKVFFIDSGRHSRPSTDAHRRPSKRQQIEQRTLKNGRAFEIVKNYYDPASLAPHFAAAGLAMTIRETANFFIYGAGLRT